MGTSGSKCLSAKDALEKQRDYDETKVKKDKVLKRRISKTRWTNELGEDIYNQLCAEDKKLYGPLYIRYALGNDIINVIKFVLKTELKSPTVFKYSEKERNSGLY